MQRRDTDQISSKGKNHTKFYWQIMENQRILANDLVQHRADLAHSTKKPLNRFDATMLYKKRVKRKREKKKDREDREKQA